MPRKPSLFDTLPEPERHQVMRFACQLVFGADKGKALWKSMEPALLFKARQLGDAPDPKDNFWKGAWRIYEAE
ncbi:MAG: hypothetical protein U0359_22270 [Byssovorax sp.]